eukprot:1067147-Amorphochlora_amoeboformis.AAC.1
MVQRQTGALRAAGDDRAGIKLQRFGIYGPGVFVCQPWLQFQEACLSAGGVWDLDLESLHLVE